MLSNSISMRCVWRIACCLATLLSGSISSPSLAGDWPQILGPNRNGVAVDEPLIAPWPKSGPPSAWSAEVGSGFAGPAVVGNRLFLFYRVKNVERIECFDADSGKRVWQTDFPASYPGGVNPDNGPRCVPLVHNQRLYLFGADGDLHCVQAADGAKVWSRDPYSDYDGDVGYFGAGSTPIVVDQKLLVNVGGRDAGIVAFDLANGKTLWQATDERASYSSPTTATLNGKTHAIFVTRLECVAIDPRNGEIAFRFPFGRQGPTVNGASPLVFDQQLFVSSSYNIGARLFKLAAPPVEIWSNDVTMSSQYTTSVHRNGYLYGIHGREDFGDGELRCVQARTGKVHWKVPGFGTGHLILAGDRLIVLTTDGQLVLAAADPAKYSELARAMVSSAVTRALPALSKGRYYFRDNQDSQGRLVSLNLASVR